jgi:hypothetical protein
MTRILLLTLTLFGIGSSRAASVEVDVETLNGDKIKGTLTSIDSESVTIKVPNEDASVLSLLDLRAIRTKTESTTDPESDLVMTLVDGSVFPLRTFTQKEGVATVTNASLGEFKIPARTIAHVLMKRQAADSDIAEQWKDLIKTPPKTDLVVFRRDEALDYFDGVIHEVGEESVDFGFEGNRISPRRNRLEGLIFFHGPVNKPPATLFQIVDHLGGKWQVASAVMDGELVEISTPAGAKVRLSLNRISAIDFGSSNTIYLSNLEMERAEWRPFLQFGPISAFQQQRFGPKKDQSLNGGPLELGGRVFQKGLALHSRTEISYRLTETYTTFRAVAGLDRRNVGKVGGVAELILSADGGRELFRGELRVDAPPTQIEIKLEDVRRLTIIVDFGDENDIGDHVILGEARLTK